MIEKILRKFGYRHERILDIHADHFRRGWDYAVERSHYISNLKMKYQELMNEFGEERAEYNLALNKIEKLEKKIEIYEGALEFYGNPGWFSGKTSREALKKASEL